MMEVKHSPATQMEFRSSRSNGLSENVEEELETLFDEDDSKTLTQKTEKCDAKIPILNGMSKRAEESSPVETLDDLDIDLDLKKDSNDKADGEKEDSELYDPDLEPECTGTTQNGEITDSSNVRDTGDDLDTLLSKINDLVEDCMDEPKVAAQKANADAVVDIADDLDDLDDVKDQDGTSSEVKSNSEEAAAKPEIQKDSGVEVKKQGTAEKADSVIDSGTDKMEVDDFVYCLDSPSDEGRMQAEEVVETEQVSEDVEEAAMKEAVEDAKTTEEKEPVPTPPAEEDDDDVFLIEDDEDEETVMEPKPAAAKEGPEKETEKAESESEKELDREIEKEKESKNVEAKRDEAPTETFNEEDDDIVCLDDSIEEIEEKETEQTEETSESNKDDAVVESAKEKEPEKEDTATVGKVALEQGEKEGKEDDPAGMEVDKDEKEQEVATEPAAPASTPAEDSKEEEREVPKPEQSSAITDDDDVVILDDDDVPPEASTPTTEEKIIDQPSTSESCGIADEPKSPKEDKPAEEEPNAETPRIPESSAILSDNSDNARDGVEEKEDADDSKPATEQATPSADSNSCSASDSLLKESTKGDRPESEENNEQPPTKKLRLSQDESNSRLSILSQEETKSNTQDPDNDEVMDDSKPLKRVRSTESISADFKKPKTDPELDKADDSNSKDSKDSKDLIDKIDTKPLPLYPPPKLDPPSIDLSLDFLKRFKKTIHKMTKADLEELVLQKIVEVIVHKSEFSEMRDLIEKQDKIIAGHRTKITELNKQFRDLEMVHNRVLKDLETKNSQFVMPVKITRAVGLQVFFPAKKFDPTLAPLAPQNTAPVPPAHSPRNASNLSTHSSDRSSHSSPVTVNSHTQKSSTATSTQAAGISSAQQQAAPQRRGCVQKLTPLRPDTPRNSPLNRSISAGVVSSSTPSPSTSRDQSPKYSNQSGPQKARVITAPLTSATSAKIPVAVVQNDAVPSDQPEKHKPAVPAQHIVAKRTGQSRTAISPKQLPLVRTSDPQTVAQPLPAAATVIRPSIPLSSAANTNAATKAVQKSVIDLTDEDDIIPPPASHSPRTPAQPATQVPTPPQPSAAPSGSRPYKVSVVPQQQLQQPKPNPPKQMQHRALAPKQNGVAIRQVTAAPSRYRHPAPLPNQPTHSSNPAWKLPPARPTIRISNLESGIVISWTIEDTAKDKYAESTSYQIYAYQETSGPPMVESWRHVGDVKAMLLPMAVTLTQFQEGQRYYFAVRAVDAHNRCGPFSFAKTWS